VDSPDIRPLELTDEPSGHAPRARRMGNWLIPLAVAAAAVAIAATLTAVSQASTLPQAPTAAAIPAAVPTYYAAITKGHDVNHVAVVDDRTGEQLLTFAPPAGETFVNVTAAADDRTFLLTSQVRGQQDNYDNFTWALYLLRISPGSADRYRLTKLPIKPAAALSYLASLSPDGTEVAVMSYYANSMAARTTTLQIYSVSSATPLRTWTANLSQFSAGLDAGWLSDGQHVDFSTWAAGRFQERVIAVTAPSGNLAASSRVIFNSSRPGDLPCKQLTLTPDGGTVICGTEEASANGPADPGCGTSGPVIAAYSASTGKLIRVLEKYPHSCLNADSVPLWSAPGAKDVIGVFWSNNSLFGQPIGEVTFGVSAGGQFTELPLPQNPLPAGAIAF
jgi:hypothetical protein